MKVPLVDVRSAEAPDTLTTLADGPTCTFNIDRYPPLGEVGGARTWSAHQERPH